MRTLGIGDIVEVKKIEMAGLIVTERWLPASVTYVDEVKIGAAYKDGTKEMIPRGLGMFR